MRTIVATSWLGAVAVALLGGCASPIKPAVLDASGPKMRHAIVAASFANAGGNKSLDARALSDALAAAMASEAGRQSGGTLRVSPAHRADLEPGQLARTVPGATHVIVVDAVLTSTTSVTPGYWNGCAYTSKDGKCMGSYMPDTTNYSRVRLKLHVTEASTGRTTYRSDDAASRPVLTTDKTATAAAEGVARASLRALKEAGLY